MEQQAEITVVFGPNGSGKTQYVERLRRQLASDSVRYLAFSDAYGPATDRAYYLQLRWNQHDIDEETPCVSELLDRTLRQTANEDMARCMELRDQLYQLFNFSPLLDKYIILLSSGELRKFQLIKTLLANPRTLILDNPYIGLDAQARQQLDELLPLLATQRGIHLYLVVARQSDIPDYATEVIKIEGNEQTDSTDTSENTDVIPRPTTLSSGDDIIDMRHVSIRYGSRTILKDINWHVKRGERWAVSGKNGSGKSTLLSLVCADNPQGYACDIALFGHPRGSGESIWEIKKRIGYVSPEMHHSYQRNLPTINVVASGLKDTVGLYVRPDEREKALCLKWMELFGIAHLAQRSFITLSSGEQRLALVTRAFVKSPELLILDEPLHGLDDANSKRVLQIIEDYCKNAENTLIMVSHYDNEIPACVDKHLFLEQHL
jgi:molybdate transport system ATP-binding protein